MRIATYLLVVIVIFFGFSFAVLNATVVTVNYYLGESSLPLSWLLVIVFAVGCLLGLAVGVYLLIKLKVKHYPNKQISVSL